MSTIEAADMAATTHHREPARAVTVRSVREPFATAGYRHRIDSTSDRAARALLAQPPRPPRDPDLFTSNTLFGEPGIYPQGSPMAPASGSPMADDDVRAELARLAPEHAPMLDEPRLADAAPDTRIRAALVVLCTTVAAPVVDAFPTRTTAGRLDWGTPDSPGRIVGPSGDDAKRRVVNDRYRAEHFTLVAPSLAHDLLWTPDTSGHAAEAFLHALVAMVHLQLVASDPAPVLARTELARRQSSLAITLLNSRHPGSDRISLIAPDGPGTIPGGAPGMQTPDFWSIPFAPPRAIDSPPLLAAVLDRLVDPSVPRPEPLRFDDALGALVSEHLDDRWLPPAAHLAAAVALGLVDEDAAASVETG